MPLYKIEESQKKMEKIEPSKFPDLKMREREDLQALLRDNPQAIEPELFIFAEEFSNWEDSQRRVDLFALDKNSNPVVIELKRIEGGGHMELQALRYAAMLSALDFEDVVKAFRELLSKPAIAQKRGIKPSDAEAELLKFLEAESADEVTISSTTRIILMAPSFSKEITTTVIWLNERNLDIRCLEIKPYKIGTDIYMDVEQVIPLPSADAYLVQKKREKTDKAERQATAKRGERLLPDLVDRGILKPQTRLELIKMPRPGMTIPDASAKRAEFLDVQKVRWEHDGKEYSLSGLCRVICEQYGGSVGKGSFRGSDYWAIEGEKQTLTQKAQATDNQSSQMSASGNAVSVPNDTAQQDDATS